MRVEDLEICLSLVWVSSFSLTVSFQSAWKLRKEEAYFLKVSISDISLPNHFWRRRGVGYTNRRES